MQKYQDSVIAQVNGSLSALAGATITVVNTSGGSSTIYSDNGITPITTTLLTDSNGLFTFYAADGLYTITIVGSGVTVTRTNVLFDDPASDPTHYAPLSEVSRAMVAEALLLPITTASASTGSTLIGTIQSGTGAVARTQAQKNNDFYAVFDFGVIGDNSTDDTNAINQAIANIKANGGGYLLFNQGKTYKHVGTIILADNVFLFGYGTTLNYTGSTIAIQSPTTGFMNGGGMDGFTLAHGSAITSIQLNSPYGVWLKNIKWTGTSYTNTLLRITVNATGSTNPSGNYNAVFNHFENLLCSAVCGTYIQLVGSGPVGGPPTSVVTLNTFHFIQNDGPGNGCCLYGIDFNQWADTNCFTGTTRINLPNISQAINAIGMIQNSQGATSNYGVYDNYFDQLAVDTFGSVGSDNRIGVKLNFSARTKINQFCQGPVGVGGDLVIGANCYSFDINKQFVGGTTSNNIQKQLFGCNLGIGGASNFGYSLYTSSYSLTGTTQASAVFSDVFASDATTAGYGMSIGNSTQATAFTMATYYGLNIANIVKGASSAVTAQVGIRIADLTSGASNNYAINCPMTSGAGKWGVYFSGTVRNYFGGGLEVLAGVTTAAAGFNNITAAAGAPTGVPTNPTGNVPLYYDTTNNFLYIYNGGWKKSTVYA